MDRLRVERLKRGISQKELAKQLGVTPSYLSRVEKGRLPFPDVLQDKINILFGINEEEETKAKQDKQAEQKLSKESYEIYKEYADKGFDVKAFQTTEIHPKFFELSLESQKLVENFICALYDREKK